MVNIQKGTQKNDSFKRQIVQLKNKIQTSWHTCFFLFKQIWCISISIMTCENTVPIPSGLHIVFNFQESRFCQFTFVFLGQHQVMCVFDIHCTFQVYTVRYCRMISYTTLLSNKSIHNRNILSEMLHRCQRWHGEDELWPLWTRVPSATSFHIYDEYFSRRIHLQVVEFRQCELL